MHFLFSIAISFLTHGLFRSEELVSKCLEIFILSFCSVQFSHSVVSDSSWPHGPQHTRPSYLSPTPRVRSNSYPLSWWCHPTISSFLVLFSSWLQSFPASGSFQMSQLFASGGQSIGVSASTSVLPMNTQDRSPWWWTGWITLQSKRLSRVFSQQHSSKASILQCSAFFIVQLSHPYTTTGKTNWVAFGKIRPVPVQNVVKGLIQYLPSPSF